MDNVTFVTDIDGNEHAIIDHGNGQFTSMLKSTYDAMQAEQFTPTVEETTQPTLTIRHI